jgi:hypothetical protein
VSQTVICIKWGSRYGADYVNRLLSMIRRQSARDTRLVCFTDNDIGIDPAVTVWPLPDINIPEHVAWLPWRKISLWQAPLADLAGDILFLDLDVVVTGSIDVFFDYKPGCFCVAENWTQPGQKIGNTSCYRFPVGDHAYIFDDFNRNPEAVLARYRVEQHYISDVISDMHFWPSDWCLSFKHSLMPAWPLNFFYTPSLPETARVIAFTGKPDPDEAVDGVWPVKAPWKRFYKHVRPTPWIAEYWR